MKLYRVITENIHFQAITDYLKEHKLDATILSGGYGLWHGHMEKSIVIEIVDGGDMQTQSDIESLVYYIKKYNKQERVMLQILNADVFLL